MPDGAIFISRLRDRVTRIIIFSECEADLTDRHSRQRRLYRRSTLTFSNRIPVSQTRSIIERFSMILFELRKRPQWARAESRDRLREISSSYLEIYHVETTYPVGESLILIDSSKVRTDRVSHAISIDAFTTEDALHVNYRNNEPMLS